MPTLENFKYLEWAYKAYKAIRYILEIGVSNPRQLLHRIRKMKFWGISWDFIGFLGMSAEGGGNIHVSSFQVLGHNHTGKPISRVEGNLRSNVTNIQIPVLLESMPPEQTNGVPRDCRFWIRALFRDPSATREGIMVEKFLREFGDFTFTFIYDNRVYTYRFKHAEVQGLIESFRKSSNPPPRPMVTRRES